MMGISIGWPLGLWAIVAVPLVVGLALGSRFALSPRRRWLATTTRALTVALIVLAMADLRLAWPTEELAIAAVIDGSPAIASAERTALVRELERLQKARPDIPIRLVGAAHRDSPNVARDLAIAVATLPLDRVRRILLATDGRDPQGHLLPAVDAARRAGVEVDVLPVGASPPVDRVSISGLDAPRLVRPAETLDVSVTVHASVATRGRLEAFFDGRNVATVDVDVPEGSSTRSMSLPCPDDPGVHELEVAWAVEGDPVAVNNRWRALVEVLPKPRVRVYREGSGAEPVLARVLREAGLEVEVVPPAAAFTSLDAYDPYALVIADEIDLDNFSEVQQQVLRRWVEEEGGGLITVTGACPVRHSPRILREIEPIEPPPALPDPRPIELVLVIDRSGSMSGYPMEAARRAGVAAVRALRPGSLVGAVAFSGAADRVHPPVPVEQADAVIEFIQSLHADGGTNIAAAIQAANRIMSHDPRYIHHVILVSDGESEPQSAIAAAMALAGRGVSISTITIGPYSPLLAEIARIGRGRYHVTSAAGLGSVVVSEAIHRQPPAHRETSFRPREQTHLPMFDGIHFEEAPALHGHALASPRRGATVALTATEGMPLLALWHRGLGQVASFTSATNGSWADAWRTWPGFRAMWVALARGMLRSRTIDPPRIAIERDPVRADLRIVTITSPFLEMELVPVVRWFRAPNEVEPVELEARGPGVFQAELPIGAGLLVDARMPFDPEPTAAAGDDLPYPAALRTFGPDRAAIARLAALGGGRVLDAPADVLDAPADVLEVRHRAEVLRPMRTPLLVAALFFYLLGLLWLRMPDRRLASALQVQRPSRMSVPARGRPRAERSPAPTPTSKEAA
jgi:hypothetical protein